ncbi:hypothetical protein L2E82_40287 [Cichorium intybus]|uniref:Uncharacterized protein n=1 Tax=Cichorium intybus TaxID=13427 RepID=A0ACB9AJU5_CICIN|nr:hypothetical protein L2E82_40287 [Cichorium intybus]
MFLPVVKYLYRVKECGILPGGTVYLRMSACWLFGFRFLIPSSHSIFVWKHCCWFPSFHKLNTVSTVFTAYLHLFAIGEFRLIVRDCCSTSLAVNDETCRQLMFDGA